MASETSLMLEAHERIRSDIIEGRIRPNVHLVAADLAERLGISRPDGMAARLVAEHATDEQIAAIEDLGAHLGSAVTDDRTVIVRLNSAFHRAIEEAAGNKRLTVIIERNSEYFFNYRIADQCTPEEATAAIVGHARVLDAIPKARKRQVVSTSSKPWR